MPALILTHIQVTVYTPAMHPDHQILTATNILIAKVLMSTTHMQHMLLIRHIRDIIPQFLRLLRQHRRQS